ncbi:hypothetical protein [uncultured Roseovarius sp.]|uniref:hypothetical protein n=1 Tax=uncultured Roseovarius sp. TaxID=293344 RepID=UPI0025D5DD0C|nr:hypothetical protein [uncultured Roseovarius sp.]
MIVGLILVGGVIGTLSALTVLILGHSIWMAFLIYCAVGALSMLAGGAILALRAGQQDWAADATPRPQGS